MGAAFSFHRAVPCGSCQILKDRLHSGATILAALQPCDSKHGRVKGVADCGPACRLRHSAIGGVGTLPQLVNTVMHGGQSTQVAGACYLPDTGSGAYSGLSKRFIMHGLCLGCTALTARHCVCDALGCVCQFPSGWHQRQTWSTAELSATALPSCAIEM